MNKTLTIDLLKFYGRKQILDFERGRYKIEKITKEILSQLTRFKSGRDPLFDLADIAVETGIKDLAEHHNHYLYGVPK